MYMYIQALKFPRLNKFIIYFWYISNTTRSGNFYKSKI